VVHDLAQVADGMEAAFRELRTAAGVVAAPAPAAEPTPGGIAHRHVVAS
jgi:hypothetical protein